MRVIKQSTSIDVGVGPFLDDTDGKTAETGLTITQPDVRLKKNGGAWAQKAAAQTLTHEEAGWYEVTLDATDTDTVGQLIVAIHESGALPVWEYFQVVEEAVYDMLFAASALGYVANAPVNVAQFGGSNLTSASGIPEVKVASLANNAITAASIASDAITDAKVASDVTIASVTGAVGSVTGAVGSVTGAVGSVTGAVGSVTGNVGGNVVGSVASVAGAVGSVTGNVGGNVVGSVASVVGAVGSVTGLTASDVGAIKTKTDSLTFTVANVLDANIQRVNDVAIVGDGSGTPWGP
jgi:hypothetical protein